MNQDVTQWLEEIEALKHQLAEAQRDRDESNASAANWRQLYTTEAKQRRTDNRLAQQTIEGIREELQRMKGGPIGPADEETARSAAEMMADRLQNIDELRQQLVEAVMERDRLIQALKQEQTNHAETRKNLTIALGDAIDRLAKEQADRDNSPATTSSTETPSSEDSDSGSSDAEGSPAAETDS